MQRQSGIKFLQKFEITFKFQISGTANGCPKAHLLVDVHPNIDYRRGARRKKRARRKKSYIKQLLHHYHLIG